MDARRTLPHEFLPALNVRDTPAVPDAATVAGLLEARSSDDRLGLQSTRRRWTWSEVVDESRRRAAVALELTAGTEDALAPRQLHIGILLDNGPEYLFWMGGASLIGAVVVGINPTRRGDELAGDIRFTECGLIVTDSSGSSLLNGLEIGVETSAVVEVDDDSYSALLACSQVQLSRVTDACSHVHPDDLYMLIFTSGTTGSPKAVKCTQGRLAMIGARASQIYAFDEEDVCYCPMPLFHGNAVMALWAPALFVGASVAVNGRFSATRFIEDVRTFDATRFTYVGKALAYVLATEELPTDGDNRLKVGFGTEASARDRADFERRFGCTLVEGYGSSEGGVAITRTPDTPPEALGMPAEGVAVLEPLTGAECERARISDDGRLLNGDHAIGELASRGGVASFEGYFKNSRADVARVRDGWYWTGDLAYRDEAGYVYFAGRSGDWLRVDSENFAAAPIERILERHADVVAAAVYAVPDASSADQVMAAVELRQGASQESFTRELGAFLESQPDLGTKWSPRYVRLVDSLPLTATGKITKTNLKAERWECGDVVLWRSGRRETGYRVLTAEDIDGINEEFASHGRAAKLA